MTSFSFIHCADIHLDSPLRGLAAQEGHAPRLIRSACRRAFEILVDHAIDEGVAFVVIAGDLYDGTWRDCNTGFFFIRQMGRLNDAGIDVYLVYGNHDAESRITRQLTLPGNVHVFGASGAGTFIHEATGAAIHGRSYATPDVTENLVPSYPAPVADMFNIGVLHTGLGGMGGHADYAPCSLADLVARAYDYWALGHVHSQEVLHRDPWVVFPGNIQGRHIRETGPRGYVRVTVADNGVEIQPVAVDVVRWAHVNVDAAGLDDLDEVLPRMSRAIEDAVDRDAGGRLMACRIEFTGATGLHGTLVLREHQLLEEARAMALGLGEERAWIERVVVSTSMSAETTADGSIGDIADLIAGAAEDPDLVELLRSDVAKLLAKLPREIISNPGTDLLRLARDQDTGALLEQERASVMSRLLGG